MINQTEFNQLAKKGYNRIPLMREVLADLDTPLSTYMKLCTAPYTYLFESVQGGEKWGRYSIIGLPAKRVITATGTKITIKEDGNSVDEYNVNDPLAEIEKIQQDYKVAEIECMPRFNGGLVGYFGYETIRYIEPRLIKNDKDDPIGSPDILLMVSDEVIVFDNLGGKLYIIVHADPNNSNAFSESQKRLDELVEKLANKQIPQSSSSGSRTID